MNSKWLYLKIGMYGILFYSVVTVMQYVKSSSFSSNVEVLMGSPAQSRSLDWCSNSVQVVLVVPTEATIRDPKVIYEICHLPYSSYKQEELAKVEWRPFFKALNEKGEETILEADQTLGFLKKGSMIYKTEGLKTKLTQLGVASAD